MPYRNAARALASLVLFASNVSAQDFNIDVGQDIFFGSPSSAHGGAAGNPGVWNITPVGAPLPLALVDTAGNPTSATLTTNVYSLFSSNNAATSGDAEALLDDAQCVSLNSTVRWDFVGLLPGIYEIYVYAWEPTGGFFPMGVTVLGAQPETMPVGGVGSGWTGTYELGEQYSRHVIYVSTGMIEVTVSSFDPYQKSLGAMNGFQLVRASDLPQEACFGDGGVTQNCTPCPCGNDAPFGSTRGCLNSAQMSGELRTSGLASAANDSLRFEVSGLPPASIGLLFSGSTLLPANPTNPCFGLASGVANAGDGLRCIGGTQVRHGTRPSDANGDIGVTTGGWGPPSPPAGGLVAQGGYPIGSTLFFQVFYRDLQAFSCRTGINTTQAVSVTITP